HTCKVVRSAVREHFSSPRAAFTVDVLYAYTVSGRRYQSDRFELFPATSTAFVSRQRIADQYVPGAPLPCFVNPDDPSDAVLNRGASAYFLLGLVPLILLPGGILLATLPGGQGVASVETAPSPLRLRLPAALKFSLLLLFSMVWNSIAMAAVSAAV